MYVNRHGCCVLQAERREWSSVWHWSHWSPELSKRLVGAVWHLTRSQSTSILSYSALSSRWLFSPLTRSSCVKFVVERPATPPAISESNITSQPRPTRPCLPSCWSPLRSSMFCSTARCHSAPWRTGRSKSTSCFNSTLSPLNCYAWFTSTTSTCTWSQANSFVHNYTNSFVVVLLLLLLLLGLLLLQMILLERQDAVKLTLPSEVSCTDVEQMNEWINECDLRDAITETVAGALNKIKF